MAVRLDEGGKLHLSRPIRINQDHQCGFLLLFPAGFDPLHAPKDEDAQPEHPRSQKKLACAKAESHQGSKPQGGSRRNTSDHIGSVKNRARSDKPHAGQNSQGEAHNVHGHERIPWAPCCPKHQVAENHAGGRREAHQNGRAETRRFPSLTSVDANDRAGDQR